MALGYWGGQGEASRAREWQGLVGIGRTPCGLGNKMGLAGPRGSRQGQGEPGGASGDKGAPHCTQGKGLSPRARGDPGGAGGYLVPRERGGEAVAVEVAAGAQVGEADGLAAAHRRAPLADSRRTAPHPPVAVAVIRRRHPGHRLLPAACREGRTALRTGSARPGPTGASAGTGGEAGVPLPEP